MGEKRERRKGESGQGKRRIGVKERAREGGGEKRRVETLESSVI